MIKYSSEMLMVFSEKKKTEQWGVNVILVKQIFDMEGITAILHFLRK